MSYAVVDIVNKAFGKIGGAGDALSGDATLDDMNGTDKITTWCNKVYPQARKKVITEAAVKKSPFSCTRKFADLGRELRQYDEVIENIVSSGGVVTVTTESEHEYTTGETIVLLGVRGTLAMETALNNSAYTITVVDTTNFTLDDLTGTDSWEYTADSGVSSYVPEIGEYLYAFNLPSDCIDVIDQVDEAFVSNWLRRQQYRWDKMLNAARDGWVFIANSYSNYAADSAFIEYVNDETDTTLYPEPMVEAIATYLAAELCPILGRNLETRQQMLWEYKNIALPDAIKFNGSQKNKTVKRRINFLGGRGEVYDPSPINYRRRTST